MVEDVSTHNENASLSFSKENSSTLLRLLANVSPLSINEAITHMLSQQ